jgi:hypothetical protein
MAISGVGRTSKRAQTLQGKRGLSERPDCEAQEQQGIVVPGRPVEVELVAAETPVDQDPLTVGTGGDGNGLHGRSALGISVAGNVIVKVTAPQAARAMVAMFGARRVEWHVELAMTAAERTTAAVGVRARMARSVGQRRTSDGRGAANRTLEPGRARPGQAVSRFEAGQGVTRRDATTFVGTVIGHHLS